MINNLPYYFHSTSFSRRRNRRPSQKSGATPGKSRTVHKLMSCAWICASCRRSLRQQARSSRHLEVSSNRHYIPFRARNVQDEDQPDQGAQSWPRRVRRRSPEYIDWQFEKSVEKDFLQRISESRGPINGPYSKGRPPKAKGPKEDASPDDRERGGEIKEERSSLATAQVFRRNGKNIRGHPLDPEASVRQRKPWFGIPDDNTPLSDLGYSLANSGNAQHLSASLGLSGYETSNNGDDYYAHQSSRRRPGDPRQSATAKVPSFFDQCFDEARSSSEPSRSSQELKDTLESLQTAHRLSTPLGNTSEIGHSFTGDEWYAQAGIEQGRPPSLNGLDGQKDADRTTTESSEALEIAELSEDLATLTPEHPAEKWKALRRLNAKGNSRSSRATVVRLCGQVVDAWCEGGSISTRVPEPAKLLKILGPECSKQYHAANSVEVLWVVLGHAIGTSLGEVKTSTHTAAALTGALLSVWSGVLEDFAECYVIDSKGLIQQCRGSADWSKFISSEQMTLFEQQSRPTYKARLLEFFPQAIHPSLESLDTAALATWALLDASFQIPPGNVSVGLTPNAVQAHKFFAKLANGASISTQSQFKKLQQCCRSAHDSAAITQRLRVLFDLKGKSHTTDSEEHHISVDGHDESAKHRSFELSTKRIGRAVEAQDPARLEQAWRKIQKDCGATRSKVDSYADVPSRIYARLLTAFMAIGRPNRAVDIWNTMTRAGVKPSIEHWDAMLKGCGLARNAEAVQTVWSNLVAAGVNPDAQLWATRIHSLGSSGRIEAAVDAFQSMSRAWLQASSFKKSSASKVPKPNTPCLNALIAVLSRANRHSQLIEVLSMRKSLKIPADSFTYNPLLKAALRDANLELASKVIILMRSSGVDPDIATFTMMLDSAFQQQVVQPTHETQPTPVPDDSRDTSDLLKLEETGGKNAVQSLPAVTSAQSSAISMVFDTMTKQGLQPTAHTFTTLVTGLLHSTPPNVVAAHGVLQYLASEKLPLSPQIYTALATHHFESSPPDLTAVEALWHDANHRQQADQVPVLDTFFFDRFIEGWARADQVSRALEARRIAKSRGKVQSWDALRELLQSLSRTGQWTAAQALVRETTKEEEVVERDQARSRRGSTAFLESISSMGLAAS